MFFNYQGSGILNLIDVLPKIIKILDLSVHKAFDSATGLIAFLGRSQKCDKIFRDSNSEILKLLKRLIIEQSVAKLNDYAKDTAEVTNSYI